MKNRTSYLIDGLALYLLAAALIWPLFRIKYMTNWGTIEGTFVSQAHFLMEHWPHPRWQPLWYCGTRFDYVYPPALPYGTALLAKTFGMVPARAYHFYTALFACAGIVGIYLLIRIGSRSRGAAWLGAAATALVSPSYLFFAEIRRDAQSAHLLPQRLNALIRYAEGPHISSLALVPIALAAGFIGLRKGQPVALALSALFSALVVSNNFYGATALAILFPVLVWSVWLEEQDRGVWWRAALIAALAYGLTAPWLSPSYLRITLRNMRLVSEPGNSWSIWVALAVAALFVLATRKRRAAWPVFVAGGVAFMSLNVLGFHYFNFRVMGEPERHLPELDLVMILAAVEALRRLWKSHAPYRQVAAAAIAVICLAPAHEYVRHAWSELTREPDYHARVETRITDWMAQHEPESRALATGSIRFWYSAWHDIAQVGGASEQGVLNDKVTATYYVATHDPNPQHCALALADAGVDALIVPGKNSQEPYHDFVQPEIFAGVLPVLYDDHQGNVIYRVPRQSPGLAHVIGKGPDSPVSLRWEGPERMRIHTSLAPGQTVLVQESYDPAWKAYADGRPVRIEKDGMNFMRIAPAPGEHEILLAFELPLENRVGFVLFGIACAIMVWLCVRRPAPFPAGGTPGGRSIDGRPQSDPPAAGPRPPGP